MQSATRYARIMLPLLMALATSFSEAANARSDQWAGFTDDLGRPVSVQTLHQPLRLVVFGYTSCPDVCPLTLLAVHQALEQLGPLAAGVDPMFVTVDPDRDTEQRLHQYVSAFDARIRGYRAADAELSQLTRDLQVRYWRETLYPDSPDYSMNHTSTLFVLSPEQKILARIPHIDQADRLAGAIVAAIRRVQHRV
jgi:protein SCO1